MACRLFGTKPLSDTKKWVWKCRLRNYKLSQWYNYGLLWFFFYFFYFFYTKMTFEWANKHPVNWRSRSAAVCYTCARYIVFQHKINFCVDVERMVCFPCVWLCFIFVSFEVTLGSCVFTLSLRCHWAHGELTVVSNQHIVNTEKNPEHNLAPICWAVRHNSTRFAPVLVMTS